MFKNTKNLTDNDRVVRVVLGTVLLVIALFGLSDMLRIVAIVLAVYGIITGVVAYCPVSEMLLGSRSVGRSTTHRAAKKRHHK